MHCTCCWLCFILLVTAHRGIKKRGGRVLLKAHVENIVVERGRATGISLRGGGRITARKAVVSNASQVGRILKLSFLVCHVVPARMHCVYRAGTFISQGVHGWRCYHVHG